MTNDDYKSNVHSSFSFVFSFQISMLTGEKPADSKNDGATHTRHLLWIVICNSKSHVNKPVIIMVINKMTCVKVKREKKKKWVCV